MQRLHQLALLAVDYICIVPHPVQTEMAGREDTAAILEALKADRTTARERQSALERQIREEARKLRGADGTCEFRTMSHSHRAAAQLCCTALYTSMSALPSGHQLPLQSSAKAGHGFWHAFCSSMQH
jgi:hypothetical protein